ncbi:uncharacterized protein LOC127857111 [Dreissena polymorpha]|uniref:Uncharacterized protein n=1 Tax=Dreissena polymorpha TaxID=45954 RepID=A0A9D4BWK1_DREPO|nr:uncharacterized protein LOC127857111 [Dreissena polymorpha]KAH3708873.1 hypothetical protein DPMN_068332 [Dreissena polymorpha]
MSWHGFQDHLSGIKYYMGAVVHVKEYNSANMSFTNVGLLTSFTFTNLNLKHGESYYGIVKAVDAAGHESTALCSPEQSVDATPPKGFTCDSTQQLPIGVSYKVDDGDLIVVLNAKLIKDTVYYIHGAIRSTSFDLNPILTIDGYSVILPLETHHDGLLQYQFTFVSQTEGTQYVEIEFGDNVDEEILHNVSIKECNMLSENNDGAVYLRQIGPYSIAVSLLVLDAESDIRTVSLGVGTTKGGFQIQSVSELLNRNNVEVIFAQFTHGTPVYVTAIAENHAGLTTVFHSDEATIIDHTAPLLYDIDVSVAVDRNNSISSDATWKVNDDESDVQFRRCSVGSAPVTGDIQAERDSETLQACHTELVDLAHGHRVYVTIKCVNKVELATTLVSRSVTIYLSPPSSTHAFVHFLPVSQKSSSIIDPLSREKAWQSNASILQMEWNSFEDHSHITSFKYRIHSDGEIVLDGMAVGFKDTISNVNLKLKSGRTYTAEVKAVNGGGLSSPNVQSSLTVASEPPALSGQPATAVIRQGKLTLDWGNVFNTISGIPHQYSLVVGSRDGFSDIVDVSYTRYHLYDVIVPTSTLVSPDITELCVKITCTFNTGLFSIYSTTFKV